MYLNKFLLFFFFLPGIYFAQYTAIPDQNFEQALIDLGHDNVIDGQVLTANISSLTELDVGGTYHNNRGITDLTGIEQFTSLTELKCNHNQITSLDLSQNTALAYFTCSNNQLTSLDVSQNTALTELDCRNNQLSSEQKERIKAQFPFAEV